MDETRGATNEASSWELEIQDILEEFQNLMTGRVPQIDSNGNITVIQMHEFALVNEKGGRFLTTRMSLLVNKWTALTSADDDQLRRFIINWSDAVRMELRGRRSEFGIKMFNFESLILAIAQFVYLALCKSLKEGERNYRKGVERRIFTWPGGKSGVTEAIGNIFRGGEKRG